MKPLAVAAVAVVVLAAAAGAAFLVVGGGEEGLRPPQPAPEPRPVPAQGGTDAPGGAGNNGATEKPVLRMEDVPAPRVPKFPDPGEEPALAAELVPGDGQTFSVPWLADHVATADWRATGVHLRRSILRTRDYVRAVRAYAKDADDIYASVRAAQHDAINSTGRLFPVLAPFETPVSPAGIFASPVAYANAMAATLAAMNRPLSRAQSDALQPVFDEAIAGERELRAALPASGYLYDRELARCEHRAKLRTTVEAILDEDQRMLLSPPELRDRVGLDVFSPYALLDERCEERTADETMESLADAFLQTLFAPSDPTRHTIEPTRAFFLKEMQARVKGWPKVPNDVLSRRRHPPHAYVLACLAINRAVAEAYHGSGILTPAQVEKSKAKAGLVVTLVVRDR